jgi:predicted nucleotidyltransferase
MELKLPSLDSLPGHRRLLDCARERFAADDRFVGVLLGGSLAAGRADSFSDIDLYLFVRDDDFESVFAEREAIAHSIGPVLVRYLGDHMPGGQHQLIVWYEGPLHVDLMFRKLSEATPQWKWKAALILKDSGNAMTALKRESDLLPSPEFAWEQLDTLNQKFWRWVAYTFGKILRGELWEALDNLAWIRNEALLVMLAWTQNAAFEGHRRLEAKLDDQLSALFDESLCSREPKSLHTALMAEIRIFRELRSRLSERASRTIDERPENQMMRELDALWTKSRQRPE